MFSTFLQLPVVQNLNYLNKFKMCTHQKDFDFLIPITLGMSWVDVINNLKGWLTVLCRNKALRLDKTRHNSNNSQSECFILTYLPSVVILHTYANICRGNWMRNFQNDFTEFSEILANIFNYRGSVNFYMFFGGTNFGFMSGANHITTNNIIIRNSFASTHCPKFVGHSSLASLSCPLCVSTGVMHKANVWTLHKKNPRQRIGHRHRKTILLIALLIQHGHHRRSPHRP